MRPSKILFVVLFWSALLYLGFSDDNSTFELRRKPIETNNHWYSQNALHTDPALFHEKVQDKLGKYQAQIEQLKTKTKDDPDQAKEIRELEDRLAEAQKYGKRLKTASDASSKDVQADFENSFSGLKKSLEETSSEILPAKEVSQWKMESEIEDRKYEIEQLKHQAEKDLGNPFLEKQVSVLEEKSKAAREQLKALKDTKEADPEAYEKEFKRNVHSFDVTYEETLSRMKESQMH